MNPHKAGKPSKYGVKKTLVDGIYFDSKAESLYYTLHKHEKGMKRQEKFILQDKFKQNGKTYRAISYKPDFTHYDNTGNLVKVVDVKGVLTPEFKLKAKMFTKRYDLPVTIARKVARKNAFEEYEL